MTASESIHTAVFDKMLLKVWGMRTQAENRFDVNTLQGVSVKTVIIFEFVQGITELLYLS